MLTACCPRSTRCKCMSLETEREWCRLIWGFPFSSPFCCMVSAGRWKSDKKVPLQKGKHNGKQVAQYLFFKPCQKGRGWIEGQSSEFRELEKLLILLSNGTEIWSRYYSSPAPPHPPGTRVWILHTEETC